MAAAQADTLRALLWDVDGTVAETERDGHRVAFNQAFEQLGLNWHWSVPRYGELLQVMGARERLLHDMDTHADAPATAPERDALVLELRRRKNLAYADLVALGGITPRPGVCRLVDECRAAGVALAVVTTSSRSNVDALFARIWGAGWQRVFSTLVCAEDAPVKKPDPQAYLLALQRLDMTAHEVFALEDSPGGLQAARAAGIACGVTRSLYFADAVFEGAAWLRDDLEQPVPMTLPLLQATPAGSIAPT
jgi:HAD superfamily hydrolase (TIGR01509 family)